MKRLLKIAFAVAVILTISGMGQPLYAQTVRTQPTQIPRTLPAPAPPAPCCSITAIDTSTGVVTAKVNATGNIFQFKVNDATLLNSLKVGQGVYANFTANQVSLDGNTACCAIITPPAPPPPAPAPGTAPPPPPPSKPSSGSGQGGKPGQQKPRMQQSPSNRNTDNPTPNPTQNNPSEPTTQSAIRGATAAPCCSITAIDTSTGVVTAKENATGKIFQFKVADSALLNSLKVGQGVYANFRTMQVSLDGSTACCSIISMGTAPAPPAAAAPAPNPTPPAPQRVSPPSVATPAATPALVPPAAAQPAPASTSSGQPGSKRTSPLSPVTAPPATGGSGTRAGNSIPALLPAHSVPPGTGFQKCCTVTYIGGTVGPGGGPSRAAKVDSQGWSFQWLELPKYNPQNWPKDFQVGSPIWVNFGTAQVSTDGVTVFGNIYATPVKYQQIVYLDVMPIGIIYDPPGDPNANNNTNSSVNPIQTIITTNSTSKTTSTATVTTGSPNRLADGSLDTQQLTVSIDVNGPSPSTGPTNTNIQTSSQATMSKLSAQGGAVYPALYDRVVFFVNPTYDVTYIGTWIYDQGRRATPANPAQITKIVPHQLAADDTIQHQWEWCSALIFELQAYDAGDHLQGDAKCLNYIPSASPASGNAVKTMNAARIIVPRTPAEKLIQLDPMIAGGALALGGAVGLASPGVPQSNPAAVPANSGRFQPIAIDPRDGPGHEYHWSYCDQSPNIGFGDKSSVMQVNSTSTTTKFTGGLSLSLNPVAIAGQVTKLVGGPDLPIPGSAVTPGDAWEIDTTVTNSATNEIEWNTTGQFGGGTVPDSPSTPCDAKDFWTSLYYDWVNHTVLFSTRPGAAGTGSAVSGSIAPGARVVFTLAGGRQSTVVRADSTGQFHSKLPPGNYTYRVEDNAGHALTTTPLSVAVKPNEAVRLAPMILDGKAISNPGLGPSGAIGQPSAAQQPVMVRTPPQPFPCCEVTAIDSHTSIGTAKENANGHTFEFQVTKPELLRQIQPGTRIYANFRARAVSLDDITAFGTILETKSTTPFDPIDPQLGAGAPTVLPGTLRDEKTTKPAPTTQQSSSSSNTDRRNNLGNEDSSKISASEGTTETAIRGVTAAPPAAQSAPAVSAAAIAKPIGPVCATANSVAFMKVDGLQGESIDPCHKGEVELLSTTADGKNFSIVKRMDRASPRLWPYWMAKGMLPQVTITLFTSGSSPMKFIYRLANAKITSISASASPGPGVYAQETIALTASEVSIGAEQSATVVQPAAQPPPVQISLALENPSALGAAITTKAARVPSISVNALSVQTAGDSTTFLLQKGIDSATVQFADAYITKRPLAIVAITIQGSFGKLTFKLASAVVANDVQSSGTNQGEEVTLSPSALQVSLEN